MIYGVYSVFDRLSGYSTLTVEVNDQVAYRNFEHATIQGGNVYYSHSDDFKLSKVPTFASLKSSEWL